MSTSRRHFLKSTAAAGLVAAQKVTANDRLQIALIGAGGMGSGDTRYQLAFPGVALVAVCDGYDGRLAHAKEVWGNHLFTTRDYREVLARKELSADAHKIRAEPVGAVGSHPSFSADDQFSI